MEGVKKSGGKFRFVDFLVILLCLSGAAYSVNLFRLDLFQTLSAQNETPIGTVTIKRNTVQRRMANRVLWDRLIKESPVYSNDTIRVAELSEADLHIGGTDITLNENTLVRLRLDRETGRFQIELSSGNIDLVTATEGENVVLNIMGREVETVPGTALSAAAGNKGMELQISEGTARVKEEGGAREIAAGTMVAFNTEGSVRSDPALVVIQPRPNARYRKNGNEPVKADFSWNRINLQPNDTLRLEIAEDQYFSRIVLTAGGLDASAQVALDAGLWNWRLTFNGSILGLGRITVTDAEPELLSPARNQQFYYETELPKLYFQWSRVQDVSHYIIEVDVTPEFRNPIIRKQTAVTSFADSSLGPGIWYWRVQPVFSQISEGGSVSRNAIFHIFKGEEPQTPQLIAVVPEEPAPEQPPPPPSRVTLESPVQGTTLTGLSALRQQTVFRWSSEEAVARSRFVLSRNSNPLSGQPEVEILDPNRTIRLDRLEEGTWYWTVEAQTPGGLDISAQTARQLRVLPIPLLPVPQDRLPATGQHIGIEELKKVNIDFRWSAVEGANAYIFTLYQEADRSRRQITQIGPENRTAWATDVKTLGRGNFVWQVEAVNIGRNNVIEQWGRPGENFFVIDIPRPGPVRIINESELRNGE
ncbi:MAG: FecR family protein [Treponema sp.]|nr:FecR family protein [Treponema sp.]